MCFLQLNNAALSAGKLFGLLDPERIVNKKVTGFFIDACTIPTAYTVYML